MSFEVIIIPGLLLASGPIGWVTLIGLAGYSFLYDKKLCKVNMKGKLRKNQIKNILVSKGYNVKDKLGTLFASKEDCVFYCALNENNSSYYFKLEKKFYEKIINEFKSEFEFENLTEAVNDEYIEIDTLFKDKKLLCNVLEDYQIFFEEKDDNSIEIILDNENSMYLFKENIEGCYKLQIPSNLDINSINKKLIEMNNGYRKQIQNKVYKDVISNATEEGFNLIEEEYLEDNSVMLTMEVPE